MSAEQSQPSESSFVDSVASIIQDPPVSSDRVPRSRNTKKPPTPTAQSLFYALKEEIIQTNGPSFIERGGIPPEIGYLVARSLSEDDKVERKSVRISYNPINQKLSIKMPSHIDDVIVNWGSNELVRAGVTGFFTILELDEVSLSSTCRFDNFPIPWQSIYKEPDLVFVYGPMNHPTVLVEVGYSQSWPSLLQDKDVWFQAAPTVNVIVLVKWDKRTNSRVAGYLELFRRGAPNPTHIDIFPIPAPSAPQTLTFRRDDFYPPGTMLPAGRSTSDLWQWDINNLRMRTINAMNAEGTVPA
ncbi:hypothetical protein BDV27DRAFT_161628 [Aspergillus caelatus]|uniref:Restriction endonuclease domain-containing protein n=1 Tax=Aspergillus caelatus TaxID=61420 RepID=A0A5N6ZS58_9EURO|nr:uncharacterized protein BDV27DRAFT_161628 [Aspergillus caelatus]KAE8360457.1 hypothetical protein BDV27DRAFT_161628 [Aspergillus caelatus]